MPKKDDVKAAIEKGVAQLDAGLGVPHKEAIRRLRERRATHKPVQNVVTGKEERDWLKSVESTLKPEWSKDDDDDI